MKLSKLYILATVFFVSIFLLTLMPAQILAKSNEECDFCFNEKNWEGKIVRGGLDWATGMASNALQIPSDAGADTNVWQLMDQCGCSEDQKNSWIEFVKHKSCDVCQDECDSFWTKGGGDEPFKSALECRQQKCHKDNIGVRDKAFNGPCFNQSWFDNHRDLPTYKDGVSPLDPGNYQWTLFQHTEQCILENKDKPCQAEAPGEDDGKKWDWDCANYINASAEFEGCLKTKWDALVKECNEKGNKACEDQIKVQAEQTASTRFLFGTIGTINFGQIPGGFGCTTPGPDPQDPSKTICRGDVVDVNGFLADVWSVGSVLFGGLAILKIVFGGVMYATAAGNAQRTSSAKEHILYAIIGLVVLILANIILNILGAGENLLPF